MDLSVVQLLATRLAPGNEATAIASTTENSVADPQSGAPGLSSAATEPETEMEVPTSRQSAGEPEPQLEMLYYARLEQAPFPEDGTGVSFLLDKPYCVIGRRTADEDPVQVSIDSTKVSRRHARVQFNYDRGEYELAVWGRNGCWIEYPEWYEGPVDAERKVFAEGTSEDNKAPKPVPLVHDCVLVIGGTRLRFLLPDPPELPEPKPKGPKSKKRKTAHVQPVDSDSGIDDPNNPNARVQHQKPPYPYSYLIAQAILSSPNKRLTLNAIYQEISSRYPYFRMDVTGWQNSVRHNLSLNKAFNKVKRPDNEPGKGAFWVVAEGTEEQFSQPITYRRKSAAASATPSAANSRPETPVFGAAPDAGQEYLGYGGVEVAEGQLPGEEVASYEEQQDIVMAEVPKEDLKPTPLAKPVAKRSAPS